ncbi:MAG TPA: tetratricopeptide repeat protein [Burkholderiales bacterium]|nr:tetratricopeptide repeat protein [Burkholderiales bacterium]
MRLLVAWALALAPIVSAAQSSSALDLFNRARAGDPAAIEKLRAAAESGEADSQFQLGRAYSHAAGVRRDDAEAARWVEKAATQGHAEAQSNLGYLYSAGLGVARDSEKAISWYTRAAESGFAQAQFNLALSYLDGKLAPKDEARAFEWMHKAAAQGVAVAQAQLATFYRRGVGTEKSMEQAGQWYRKAADQGIDTAMINLAIMHVIGEGVPRDPEQALQWLKRAEMRGNAKAAAMREELCRGHRQLCDRQQVADHFAFEMTDPNLRIVIPDAPPMHMGPHPLAQAHTRFMGSGTKGYSISVLTPTADAGMTALDCAKSGSGEVARRFGLKREDVVALRTNETTFVMLFPLKVDALVQLKAFLLSGHGGTHCVQVHLSRTLVPGDSTAEEIAAWMGGFRTARIEAF